jgi:thiamine phosphate synthase YjbQ (UPF0047 family)
VQHNSIEELTAARSSGVIKRLTDQVRKAAPTSQYRHNRTGEDNAEAHLKRQIMGREVVVAITKGKLDLGPWEQVFTVDSMVAGASVYR